MPRMFTATLTVSSVFDSTLVFANPNFRYTDELHPYKYAGDPMLVKTIRMETDDDKLFSKSAPLLAAASECAFYTVKCSALNAEELRR